jgi:hypothetical protein
MELEGRGLSFTFRAATRADYQAHRARMLGDRRSEAREALFFELVEDKAAAAKACDADPVLADAFGAVLERELSSAELHEEHDAGDGLRRFTVSAGGRTATFTTKAPTRPIYRAFRSAATDPKKQASAAEQLAIDCIVEPSGSALREALDLIPPAADLVAAQLVEALKLGEEVRAKK